MIYTQHNESEQFIECSMTPDPDLPLFTGALGVRHSEAHVIRSRGLSMYQWLHTSRGSGTLVVQGCSYSIHESNGLLMAPGVPHEYYPGERGWETKWVVFGGELAPNLFALLGIREWGIFKLKQAGYLQDVFHEMLHAATSSPPSDSIHRINVLLYDILTSLLKGASLAAPLTDSLKKNKLDDQRIEQLLDYIHSSFTDRDLDLDRMAAMLGITPSYLCRIFNQAFFTSPVAYLIRIRMNRALAILQAEPQLSIRSLAERVGFWDEKYFSRAFKKLAGITPSMYRDAILKQRKAQDGRENRG